jgi:hypothetical protein
MESLHSGPVIGQVTSDISTNKCRVQSAKCKVRSGEWGMKNEE